MGWICDFLGVYGWFLGFVFVLRFLWVYDFVLLMGVTFGVWGLLLVVVCDLLVVACGFILSGLHSRTSWILDLGGLFCLRVSLCDPVWVFGVGVWVLAG